MLELNNLSEAEILLLYWNKVKEKMAYDEDLIYTKEILSTRKVDYMTKREYENDMIVDKREIDRLTAEIDQIRQYALANAIDLSMERTRHR